jgi:hypothetical protein
MARDFAIEVQDETEVALSRPDSPSQGTEERGKGQWSRTNPA